jgi:hypothetical protein
VLMAQLAQPHGKVIECGLGLRPALASDIKALIVATADNQTKLNIATVSFECGFAKILSHKKSAPLFYRWLFRFK